MLYEGNKIEFIVHLLENLEGDIDNGTSNGGIVVFLDDFVFMADHLSKVDAHFTEESEVSIKEMFFQI